MMQNISCGGVAALSKGGRLSIALTGPQAAKWVQFAYKDSRVRCGKIQVLLCLNLTTVRILVTFIHTSPISV